MAIDSLPKLIQRLRDPNGESLLDLKESEIKGIVGYDGVVDFAETYSQFLEAIKANTTITDVDFGCSTMEMERQAFPIFNTLCRHLPLAKKAKITAWSSFFLLRNDIERFKSVKISDYSNFDGINHPLLRFNPSVEFLTYYCSNPSSMGFGHIILSLPLPSMLRELHLSGQEDALWRNSLSVPQLNRLVEIMKSPSLVKVSLTSIYLSTAGALPLFAKALAGSSIQDLTIRLFADDPENYRQITSGLAKMPSLQSLQADFCSDEEENASLRGAFCVPVENIILGSSNLTSLTIGQDWNDWTYHQCEFLEMALLRPSCRLKHLDMQSSYILDSEDLRPVMYALSLKSSTIETFAFAMKQVSDKDFDTWLSILPKTSMLRTLIFYSPRWDSMLFASQGKALVDILTGWYHLEDYHGECPTFCMYDESSPDGPFADTRPQQLLRTLLRLNRAGRHYLTSPTPRKAGGVEVLIKVRDHLNDIYTHLLENPCLCDREVVGITTSGELTSPARKKARHSSM